MHTQKHTHTNACTHKSARSNRKWRKPSRWCRWDMRLYCSRVYLWSICWICVWWVERCWLASRRCCASEYFCSSPYNCRGWKRRIHVSYRCGQIEETPEQITRPWLVRLYQLLMKPKEKRTHSDRKLCVKESTGCAQLLLLLLSLYEAIPHLLSRVLKKPSNRTKRYRDCNNLPKCFLIYSLHEMQNAIKRLI